MAIKDLVELVCAVCARSVWLWAGDFAFEHHEDFGEVAHNASGDMLRCPHHGPHDRFNSVLRKAAARRRGE